MIVVLERWRGPRRELWRTRLLWLVIGMVLMLACLVAGELVLTLQNGGM